MPDLDPHRSTISASSASNSKVNALDLWSADDRLRLARYCDIVERWRQQGRPEHSVNLLVLKIVYAAQNVMRKAA